MSPVISSNVYFIRRISVPSTFKSYFKTSKTGLNFLHQLIPGQLITIPITVPTAVHAFHRVSQKKLYIFVLKVNRVFKTPHPHLKGLRVSYCIAR